MADQESQELQVYNESEHLISCNYRTGLGVGLGQDTLKFLPGNNTVSRAKLKICYENPVFKEEFEEHDHLDRHGNKVKRKNLVFDKFDPHQAGKEAEFEVAIQKTKAAQAVPVEV